MPNESNHPTPRPVLSHVAAQLFVTDIRASCDYYTTRLGFAVDYVYGDPPFYGQVVRDGARLALRHVDEPVFVGDIRQREHLLSASIAVDSARDIEQLFQDCRDAGAHFHQTLRTEAWHAQTFVVRDPDGNLILFAGPIA